MLGEEEEGTGIGKRLAFPSSHQHRLQGGQSPASCPHGSHQQPSQSAASAMLQKHVGSNTETGLEKQRENPIQANLFANAESSSDVLAVLIQHDGLADTPTTLKASQSVIIKSTKHNRRSLCRRVQAFAPSQPRDVSV